MNLSDDALARTQALLARNIAEADALIEQARRVLEAPADASPAVDQFIRFATARLGLSLSGAPGAPLPMTPGLASQVDTACSAPDPGHRPRRAAAFYRCV